MNFNKINTLIAIFFITFSIPTIAEHNNGTMITPEIYGVKLMEIDFCQTASCENAVKVGGGKRIDIANIALWADEGGTLVDLKNAPLLADTAYTHIRFLVDAQFLVKASQPGSCYTTPNKIEINFAEGTTNSNYYGEQVLWLDTSILEGDPQFSDITSTSFKYTHPLTGTYTKGKGQSIRWSVDASNTIEFGSLNSDEETCDIGVDGPELVFTVLN